MSSPQQTHIVATKRSCVDLVGRRSQSPGLRYLGTATSDRPGQAEHCTAHALYSNLCICLQHAATSQMQTIALLLFEDFNCSCPANHRAAPAWPVLQHGTCGFMTVSTGAGMAADWESPPAEEEAVQAVWQAQLECVQVQRPTLLLLHSVHTFAKLPLCFYWSCDGLDSSATAELL